MGYVENLAAQKIRELAASVRELHDEKDTKIEHHRNEIARLSSLLDDSKQSDAYWRNRAQIAEGKVLHLDVARSNLAITQRELSEHLATCTKLPSEELEQVKASLESMRKERDRASDRVIALHGSIRRAMEDYDVKISTDAYDQRA